jgi:hypothetical protein
MSNAENLDLEDFKDFSSITSLGAEEGDHSKDDSKLTSTLYYKVWENNSPYIRKFDEDYFHKSKYY